MPLPPLLQLAASQGLETELIIKAGGAAATVALLGLILVLPLFLGQRREIRRLSGWQQLRPEAGDTGGPDDYATVAPTPARPGELSPAERVTGDRPALERITAERAAVVPQPSWRRILARGPRHPLVLSAIAVLIAIAAVTTVALTGQLKEEQPAGAANKLDRTSVDLVVLNGSSQAALAGKVADSLTAAGFSQIRTGATGTSRQTVVLYAKENERAARVLGRELGVRVVQPLDRATRAAAPGADVVVIAGEDRAKA